MVRLPSLWAALPFAGCAGIQVRYRAMCLVCNLNSAQLLQYLEAINAFLFVRRRPSCKRGQVSRDTNETKGNLRELRLERANKFPCGDDVRWANRAVDCAWCSLHCGLVDSVVE